LEDLKEIFFFLNNYFFFSSRFEDGVNDNESVEKKKEPVVSFINLN
jgi:hypothetical protein